MGKILVLPKNILQNTTDGSEKEKLYEKVQKKNYNVNMKFRGSLLTKYQYKQNIKSTQCA